MHWVSLYNVVYSLLSNIQGFYLCNVVPRVLKQHWKEFFSGNPCLELLLQHCTRFYLCNVVPRVLRPHWTIFFSVYCCLEPQREHSVEYLPWQCFPRSIKTWFFLCNLVWNLLNNIAQGSYLFSVGPCITDNFNEGNSLCSFVLTMLGQYCI